MWEKFVQCLRESGEEHIAQHLTDTDISACDIEGIEEKSLEKIIAMVRKA